MNLYFVIYFLYDRCYNISHIIKYRITNSIIRLVKLLSQSYERKKLFLGISYPDFTCLSEEQY